MTEKGIKMAERRMYTKKITDSDLFIELSSPAQALYFHLCQGADDDGFTNQIQNAMFKSHASIDDLKVLITKNFIIRFESGVIVITHWRLHNTLRKDRYVPTSFTEELAQLSVNENGIYMLGCQMVAERLPNGCHRIGKVSIDKKDSIKCDNNNPRACAREEISPPPIVVDELTEEKLTEIQKNLNYFSQRHPEVDFSNYSPAGLERIDFVKLDKAVNESNWLSKASFGYLLKHYDRIIEGEFKDLKRDKVPKGAKVANGDKYDRTE